MLANFIQSHLRKARLATEHVEWVFGASLPVQLLFHRSCFIEGTPAVLNHSFSFDNKFLCWRVLFGLPVRLHAGERRGDRHSEKGGSAQPGAKTSLSSEVAPHD